MQNIPKVVLTTEILGAYLTVDLRAKQRTELMNNPKDFIYANTGAEIEASVQVFKNDDETVHLALPYYSELDTTHAEILQDEDMVEVAGGEVIFTLIGIAIAGVVVATAVTAGLVGADAEAFKRGEYIDGSPRDTTPREIEGGSPILGK